MMRIRLNQENPTARRYEHMRFAVAALAVIGAAVVLQSVFKTEDVVFEDSSVAGSDETRAAPEIRRRPGPRPDLSSAPRMAPTAPRFIIAAPVPAPAIDDRFPSLENHRLMEEQVRRMRDYAAKVGSDDPFAMTEDEIEAFRKQGDPVLW